MKILSVCFLVCCAVAAHGQYDPDYKKYEQPESPFSVGIGLGLDYGLLGGKFSAFPIKHLGLFAGVGYNLLNVGYNIGATGRILPGKKVCPYVTGMYGNNAVIVVVGASQYNKAYYGPTLGGGIELHFGNKKSFMNFGLLFPIRSQKYYDDWDKVTALPGIESTDPLPVGISVGYHLKLNNQF